MNNYLIWAEKVKYLSYFNNPSAKKIIDKFASQYAKEHNEILKCHPKSKKFKNLIIKLNSQFDYFKKSHKICNGRGVESRQVDKIYAEDLAPHDIIKQSEFNLLFSVMMFHLVKDWLVDPNSDFYLQYLIFKNLKFVLLVGQGSVNWVERL